jgi:hypothetical protein
MHTSAPALQLAGLLNLLVHGHCQSARVVCAHTISIHIACVQVLVIHVARFQFEGGEPVKLHADVHHPYHLFMKKGWFADNAPLKHGTYALRAKVVHQGMLHFSATTVSIALLCADFCPVLVLA